MKYIISRMLLLINSIIITVPIENTYNTIDNTYNTIDNTYNDFDTNNTNTNSNDSSEYLRYTTTYQEYSISTMESILSFIWFMNILSLWIITIIHNINYYKKVKSTVEII